MPNNDILIQRLLYEVKAFAGFTPQDARNVLAHASRVDVPAGAAVVSELDGGREFYIVIGGLFSVARMLASGRSRVIARLHPGDTFGEISFLDGRPRTATVTAERPGLLLRIDRQSLLQIPDTAAKLYFNLAGLMAGRIRDTNALVSLALEGNGLNLQADAPADDLRIQRSMRGR